MNEDNEPKRKDDYQKYRNFKSPKSDEEAKTSLDVEVEEQTTAKRHTHRQRKRKPNQEEQINNYIRQTKKIPVKDISTTTMD